MRDTYVYVSECACTSIRRSVRASRSPAGVGKLLCWRCARLADTAARCPPPTDTPPRAHRSPVRLQHILARSPASPSSPSPSRSCLLLLHCGCLPSVALCSGFSAADRPWPVMRAHTTAHTHTPHNAQDRTASVPGLPPPHRSGSVPVLCTSAAAIVANSEPLRERQQHAS